ncbi:MAG: ECF transporter S component [Anaerolineales bacterium]|nr:ECF transporter S component [Anaerolineales bacterium]
MSLSQSFRKEFTTQALVLIPVGIVLNIVVGQLASALKLPIFLDSIGTMLVALLVGPWAGALTGFLGNLIWGLITDPVAAPFALVALIIGLVTGLLARAGLFKRWWQALLSGVIVTLALAPVAILVRAYLFGGVTGSGADFITGYLLKVGQDLFGAVVVTVIASNLVDKVITALLAWGIVKYLPKRFTARYHGAERVVG